MDPDRRAHLKAEALRRQLDDPTLPEWRRARIRARLGLRPTLTAEDLCQPVDRSLLQTLRTFIEEHARRKGWAEMLPDLRSLDALTGFASVFESDAFQDYSDRRIAGGDENLQTEREALLMALRRIGLDVEAERIETLWRQEKVSAQAIDTLQERYWSASFTDDLHNRIGRLLRECEADVLALSEA